MVLSLLASIALASCVGALSLPSPSVKGEPLKAVSSSGVASSASSSSVGLLSYDGYVSLYSASPALPSFLKADGEFLGFSSYDPTENPFTFFQSGGSYASSEFEDVSGSFLIDCLIDVPVHFQIANYAHAFDYGTITGGIADGLGLVGGLGSFFDDGFTSVFMYGAYDYSLYKYDVATERYLLTSLHMMGSRQYVGSSFDYSGNTYSVVSSVPSSHESLYVAVFHGVSYTGQLTDLGEFAFTLLGLGMAVGCVSLCYKWICGRKGM